MAMPSPGFTAPSDGWRPVRYGMTRAPLGAVLVAAAALKAYAAIVEPLPSRQGLLGSRWFVAGVVEMEVVLGLCLITGLWLRPVRRAAIACFVAFGAVSAHRLLSGEATCGCFGRVRIHPGVMLGFDLAAAVALLMVGRRAVSAETPRGPHRRVAAVTVAGLAAAVPLPFAVLRPPGAAFAGAGSPVNSGIVLIEPEKWVGKPFPLFDEIDLGQRLKRGRWVLLFYHHDCPACREAIRRQCGAGRHSAGEASAQPQVALIEIPPYGTGDELPRAAPASVMHGRLKDSRQWFATAPLIVALEDGRVTGYRGG